MTRPVYLDYAAATPLDPAVAQAMQPYFDDTFHNPSALYLAAKAVRQDIEAARAQIAGWLGAKPAEIVFTAGGTEANNLAIRGVMDNFARKKVLISAIEHDSVREPAGFCQHQEIAVDHTGVIDLEDLAAKLDDDTVLISVMYANNEIGTIEPLAKLAKLVQAARDDRAKRGIGLPLFLHTDACQAANYLKLNTASLGVDLMTINAGKIYGPKQTGALFVKRGVQLKPQILGGGQEFGRRSGTENPAGIIGFAAALDVAQTKRQQESRRLIALKHKFIADLKVAIPEVIVNGSPNGLPNNIHITVPGQDNERLLMALDERGIMCGTGSACSASKEESSHVLKAIGLSDAEAYASLRFSLGRATTSDDLTYTVKQLAGLLA